MGIIKDPTSWRTGFELGLAGFSFPYSKPRKPTAYLYNGIRLPALPEWDRGVYPYAFINMVYPGREDYPQGTAYLAPYYLFLCKEKPYWGKSSTSSGSLTIHKLVNTGIETVQYEYRPYLSNKWETADADVVVACKYSTEDSYDVVLAWTNTDTNDYNNSLLCAASDPVPVYE